jgi:arsenite methyltransferase
MSRPPIPRPLRAPTAGILLLAALLPTPAFGEATPVPTSPASAERSDAATTRHGFADVRHWVSVFDDPKRNEWQKPREIVAALGIEPGMTVADLGAGTGYFSPYLSKAVGEDGSVLAVDVEPNLVVHLRERAEQERLENVVPILASADDPRMPARGVDLIFIADTYHHLDQRLDYLPRLRRFLRSGGRVAIVDWKKQPMPQGPPPEHKLAREQVANEMQKSGYRLVGEPTFLPYQYFLIFSPR